MSDNYRVEWAEVAEKDLQGIVKYIAEDSPANALKILKKIKQKASSCGLTLPSLISDSPCETNFNIPIALRIFS